MQGVSLISVLQNIVITKMIRKLVPFCADCVRIRKAVIGMLTPMLLLAGCKSEPIDSGGICIIIVWMYDSQ